MTWTQDPIYVSGMLCMIVLLSVWLATFKGWKTIGTPILVILIAAVASNFGIIPTATNGNTVYTGVFLYLAPMGIFIALLEVDLKSLRKAGDQFYSCLGLVDWEP